MSLGPTLILRGRAIDADDPSGVTRAIFFVRTMIPAYVTFSLTQSTNQIICIPDPTD